MAITYVDVDNQATNKAELEAKKVFFKELSSLDGNSDEEHDTYNVGHILGGRELPLPDPSLSTKLTPARIRTPVALDKVPRLHETMPTSTPTSSLVKETPLGNTKSFSHPSEQASFLSRDSPIIESTPESRQLAQRRTVSNPTLGTDSLILNYSTGIESMLGKRSRTGSVPTNIKKKPRKKSSVELAPESEQIFQGKIFYYIPPDDKSPLRRSRINIARKFGATWTRELIPTTTHIVVDKALSFKDVMTFLNLESPPSNMIMVSEEYPIHSIEARFLLDPMQNQYIVPGYPKTSRPQPETENATALEQTSPSSEKFTKDNEITETATGALVSSPSPISAAPDMDTAALSSPQEIIRSPSTMNDVKDFSRFGDDLEKMIGIARNMEDVPINDEDDDREDDKPHSRDQSDESGSENDSRRRLSRKSSKSKWKGSKPGIFNQQAFTCMTGGTGITSDSNPNGRTIEILQKMADYYVETKDHWRQTAYRKAIGVLRKQNTNISSYDEAIRLPTVGHRLAMKIEEIVLTNGLRRLSEAITDPNYHTLHTFMNVYGVGINQAWKWVQQGHTSLEDLKAHASLTKNQRLGIEHYDEFLIRIPRDEVTALGDVVIAAAATIDPKVEVIIGGSYRRGAATSGDIDFILTKPATTTSQDLLEFLMNLTNHLTETGFLVAALVTPSQTGSKWHGCCVLPGAPKPIWRRIDLLLVPETELGAALIYFTGDDIFNRSIRLLASKKGWRLNQRGLYKDVLRGPEREKITVGTLIEGADEKKIFAALGVPWRPPEQRICH